MEYIHICPKCGKEIKFKQKRRFDEAESENRLCPYCRITKIQYKRNCPICGREIIYKRKGDYDLAVKHNTKCLHCSENSGKFKSGILIHTSNNNPTYSLDKLLDLSNQSFYWLGVILADGNFYKTKFEISFKASDLNFLQDFGNYIGFDNSKIKFRKKSNSYRISFANRDTLLNFRKKFNIQYCKTYNPCKFNFYENYSYNQLMSLFIGIIDGDGHISIDGKSITITAHKIWVNFYTDLINKLKINFHIRSINNTNSIVISAGSKEVRKLLHDFIQDNKLTILNRKWNRLKI